MVWPMMPMVAVRAEIFAMRSVAVDMSVRGLRWEKTGVRRSALAIRYFVLTALESPVFSGWEGYRPRYGPG